jgi:hypothetical protein
LVGDLQLKCSLQTERWWATGVILFLAFDIVESNMVTCVGNNADTVVVLTINYAD